MRKIIVIFAWIACGACLVASADEYAWNGAAGDGLWTTPGNWIDSSGTVCTDATPDGLDTAFFTNGQSVAVQPAATFEGRVFVEHCTLTVTVPDETSLAFSVAVSNAATLVKSGAGELTLKAVPRLSTGTVVAQQGLLRLSGNGRQQAPGAFGTVRVAADATVEVVASPVADRHGVSICAGGKAGSFTSEERLLYYGSYDKFETAWEVGLGVTNRTLSFHVPPSSRAQGSQALFWGGGWTPSGLVGKGKNPSRTMVRGLLLGHCAKNELWERSPTLASMTGGMLLCQDTSVMITEGGDNPRYYQGATAGWHPLNAIYWITGNDDPNMRFHRPNYPWQSSGRIYAEQLWHGACADSLVVESGGTFRVAAGQAFGLSGAGAITLSGTVVGSADSVFSVMGGHGARDLSGLAGFAGVVELGEPTIVDFGAGAVSFSLSGAGKVTARDAQASAFGSDFFGTLDVPAGTVFHAPVSLAGDAVFSGGGTLSIAELPSAERLVCFTGTVEAVSSELSSRRDLQAATVAIGSGGMLTVHNSAFLETTNLSLVGWASDPGRWTMHCKNWMTTPLHAKDAVVPVPVEGGDLLLTTDGAQYATLIYNEPFAAIDRWQVRMGVSLELPPDSYYATTEGYHQLYAERFSFVLQGNGTSCRVVNNAFGVPAGGYGFGFYTYYDDASQRGLFWVEGGCVQRNVDVSDTAMGINTRQPFDMVVGCTNGVLSITLEQDGHVFRCARDVSAAFKGGFGYMTMGGHTGWWYSKNVPWMQIRLSDFSGFCERTGLATPLVGESGQFVSGDWEASGVSVLSNGRLNLLPDARCGETVRGGAVYKPVLDTHLPCSFECDVDFGSARQQGDIADGMTLAFIPASSGMTLSPGNTRYMPAHGVGLLVYYYSQGYLSWVDDGTVIAQEKPYSPTMSTNSTMHIKLVYEGDGWMSATVSKNGLAPHSMRYRSDTLAKWGSAMRFCIFGANSTWGPYLQTDVREIAVGKPQEGYVQPAPAGSIAVSAGESAALQVDAVAETVTWPAVDDGGYAIEADGWTLGGNAAFSGGGIRLFPAEVNKKGTAICKKPLPHDRPFRLDYTVKTGEGVSSLAEGFTLCFKGVSKGCSLTTYQNCRPHSSEDVCGLTFYYYNGGDVGWYADGARLPAEKPFTFATNQTISVSLKYDGAGGMEAEIVKDGAIHRMSHYFAELTEEDFYFGFSGGTSSWGPSLETSISDVVLRKPVVDTIQSGHVSAALESVSLGSGATLSVGAKYAKTAVAFGEVSASGGATIAPQDGSRIRFERIVMESVSPSTIVVGAGEVEFAPKVTVVIPRSWAATPIFGHAVIDYSAATLAGAPAEIEVVFDDGTPTKVGAIATERRLVFSANGMYIILR